MKENVKRLYIGLFLLFLLTVFLLFSAVVNNSGGSTGIYAAIFFLMLTGTALFALAMINYRPLSGTTQIDTDSYSSQTVDEKADVKIETLAQVTDIQQLVPTDYSDIECFGNELLKSIAKEFNIVQALFYVKDKSSETYHCYAQYAYFSEAKPVPFITGETLLGQAVKNKGIVSLDSIPDNYMTIVSGLGKGVPKSLVFVPLIQKGEVAGLIEYATFGTLSDEKRKTLEELSSHVAGIIINLFK